MEFRPGIVSGMQIAGWKPGSFTRNPATGIWTPNPVLGLELIQNGGFDSDTVWSKGANWTIAAGVASHAAGVAGSLTSNLMLTANAWYRLVFTVSAYVAGNIYGYETGTGGVIFGPLNPGGNGIINCSNKSISGGVFLFWGNATGNAYIDDVSCKQIPHNQMTCIRNFGRQVALAAALTIPLYEHGGLYVRYTDENNYLRVRHDRTNAVMEKSVAGTLTSLISAAAVYADGRILEVRWADINTAQLWYNGVQIGVNQDVSTVSTGTWAGIFGTYNTVQISSIVWS